MGIALVVFVVLGWFLYQRHSRSIARHRHFDEDAVHAMKGRHSRPDNAAVIKNRYRNSPLHMALIRDLQIFGESAQLALQSKKPETAKGRFETALESYRNATNAKARCPSSVIWAELDRLKSTLVAEFPCAWRSNAAEALLQEAEGLKTVSAKMKRWQQVAELLGDEEAASFPQLAAVRARAEVFLAAAGK